MPGKSESKSVSPWYPPLSDCVVVQKWSSDGEVFCCAYDDGGGDTEKKTTWPHPRFMIKRTSKAERQKAGRDPHLELKRLQQLGSGFALRYFPCYLGHSENHDVVDVAMERCPGQELFQLIIQRFPRGMPERLARTVLCAVARALAIMHAHDVSHRDVSPENVIVDLDAEGKRVLGVKLIDFGMSCDVVRNPKTGAESSVGRINYGKSMYAPPEMNRARMLARMENGDAAEPIYLTKGDMFALGVLLGILLSGAIGWTSTNDPLYRMFHSGLQYSRSARLDRYATKTGVRLSPDAFDLWLSLTRPFADQRFSMEDFWLHPWVKGGAAEQ